jgi:hypothetical protein
MAGRFFHFQPMAGRNSILSQWQAVFPFSANGRRFFPFFFHFQPMAGRMSIFSQWQVIILFLANGRSFFSIFSQWQVVFPLSANSKAFPFFQPTAGRLLFSANAFPACGIYRTGTYYVKI